MVARGLIESRRASFDSGVVAERDERANLFSPPCNEMVFARAAQHERVLTSGLEALHSHLFSRQVPFARTLFYNWTFSGDSWCFMSRIVRCIYRFRSATQNSQPSQA